MAWRPEGPAAGHKREEQRMPLDATDTGLGFKLAPPRGLREGRHRSLAGWMLREQRWVISTEYDAQVARRILPIPRFQRCNPTPRRCGEDF